jgi:hypothetical protein
VGAGAGGGAGLGAGEGDGDWPPPPWWAFEVVFLGLLGAVVVVPDFFGTRDDEEV